MDTVCQAFLKVASLSGLIKPNILLVLSQANLLLMLATVCSVFCNNVNCSQNVACTIWILMFNKFLVRDTERWIIIFICALPFPRVMSDYTGDGGVRYGSTVIAARARPKTKDCEVD